MNHLLRSPLGLRLSVWINESFVHYQELRLSRSSCFRKSFESWQRFTFSDFESGTPFNHDSLNGLASNSVNLQVITQICSSLIQQNSNWISESLTQTWDLLLSNWVNHYLNEWIFWSWPRFTSILFRRLVFESVASQLLSCSAHQGMNQWIVQWINSSLVQYLNRQIFWSCLRFNSPSYSDSGESVSHLELIQPQFGVTIILTNTDTQAYYKIIRKITWYFTQLKCQVLTAA